MLLKPVLGFGAIIHTAVFFFFFFTGMRMVRVTMPCRFSFIFQRKPGMPGILGKSQDLCMYSMGGPCLKT